MTAAVSHPCREPLSKALPPPPALRGQGPQGVQVCSGGWKQGLGEAIGVDMEVLGWFCLSLPAGPLLKAVLAPQGQDWLPASEPCALQLHPFLLLTTHGGATGDLDFRVAKHFSP